MLHCSRHTQTHKDTYTPVNLYEHILTISHRKNSSEPDTTPQDAYCMLY